MFSEILQSKVLTRFIYGVLGTLIGLLLHDLLRKNGINIENTLKIILAPTVIFMSLLITARQFVYNREWNKKDTAIKTLYTSSAKTHEYNEKLNPILNTTYLMQHDKSLSIVDIHNKMGVFMNDGSFVFHGDEKDEDIQNIHNMEDSLYCKSFDKDIDGREIKTLITKILNEYEYICMACNLEIFDKKVVIELKGGGIIRTFKLFKNHIYHARYDTRHNYGDELYKHFEMFTNDIIDVSKSEKIKKSNEIVYKTPFDDSTRFK